MGLVVSEKKGRAFMSFVIKWVKEVRREDVMLRRIWRWLMEPRWRQGYTWEVVGYDRNIFGDPLAVYRPDQRVWRGGFSRLGWLVVGLIGLISLLHFPLSWFWPYLYQDLVERFLGEVNLGLVWMVVGLVLILLFFLFLLLCLWDRWGEISYYRPERN